MNFERLRKTGQLGVWAELGRVDIGPGRVDITNKKVTVAKLLNIVLATEKSRRKMSQTSSDTEEDGNLSVEEVLTEDQEETEEIATTEVVNGGEPAGPY